MKESEREMREIIDIHEKIWANHVQELNEELSKPARKKVLNFGYGFRVGSSRLLYLKIRNDLFYFAEILAKSDPNEIEPNDPYEIRAESNEIGEEEVKRAVKGLVEVHYPHLAKAQIYIFEKKLQDKVKISA